MNRVPDYETPLEEHLFRMLILHSSEDLKQLHVFLWSTMPKWPHVDKFYEWKASFAGRTSQIIEDILAVRQEKQVII